MAKLGLSLVWLGLLWFISLFGKNGEENTAREKQYGKRPSVEKSAGKRRAGKKTYHRIFFHANDKNRVRPEDIYNELLLGVELPRPIITCSLEFL